MLLVDDNQWGAFPTLLTHNINSIKYHFFNHIEHYYQEDTLEIGHAGHSRN